MRPGVLARRAAADVARVFACILLALAAAGPARAASGPEYLGTNLGTLSAVGGPARDGVLQALGASRMALGRIEVQWPKVQPAAPSRGSAGYDWSDTDALIERLAARNIRAVPLFRFTPGWVRARSAGKVDELPPSAYPEFGRLVAAFAARYGPGGAFWRSRPSVAALPTLSYEIWNEANLNEYAWNGVADPEAYAALIKAVRPYVRAVQPSAVLLASLAYQEGEVPNYLGRFAGAGGLNAIDAMGYHPYAPNAPETIRLVQGLRAALAAQGHPGMPIYANEAGQEAVVTNPDGSTVPGVAPAAWGHEHFPSDAARAANLAFAAEALAASNCGVEQFLPYSVSDTEQPGGKLTEAYMGLFRPGSGAPTLTALALQRASTRWAARFDSGGPGAPAPLGLCGPGSPAAVPLAIDGTFTGTGQPGCVALHTTYDGNPLEGVALTLRATTGVVVATALTNAFGDASACVPWWVSPQAFLASGDLLGAGATGQVGCDVSGIGCPAGAALRPGTGLLSARIATGAPAPAPAPTPAPVATPTPTACEWGVEARQSKYVPARRKRKAAVTLVAKVGCGSQKRAESLKFTVYSRAKGAKRKRKLRTVVLKVGVSKRLTVRGPVRVGTRVVLVSHSKTGASVPKLTETVTVRSTSKSKRKATKPSKNESTK